jgi:hypothetical protein
MLTIQHKALTVLKSISIRISKVLIQTVDHEEVYPPPAYFERIIY